MAGFHLVHIIYIELTKLGCELKELYDYSVKELLFMLKYKREGLAETTWKQGLIVRAAYSRNSFPKNPREIFLDLYEETYKKKKVPIPDWLRDDYEKRLNSMVRKSD